MCPILAGRKCSRMEWSSDLVRDQVVGRAPSIQLEGFGEGECPTKHEESPLEDLGCSTNRIFILLPKVTSEAEGFLASTAEPVVLCFLLP